jgi:type I restriction enzyme S subunit
MMDVMKLDLGKAIDNKLDRSKWAKWKFSDLVDNIVEKVKPQESGLEHYIGLEHLDSGSLHIKRFGESKSLIGDKLKIYKDDIIFAKRNAYLKRVSIAPFDAVASAHSMVLRSKAENVLPEFLPFFLLSEQFWIRAIEISVGSLSPTINWKALAKQEFLLPPKDQQAKLAELLWAMDEVTERGNELENKLKISRDVYFENLVEESKGKKVKLSQILIPKKEKSQVPHLRKKYIGLEHIESGEFVTNDFDSTESVKAQCNVVHEGDLCYSKLRPYLDKAIIATFEAVSTTELLIYDTKQVSKEYVLYHFHSKPFIDYVSSQGFGTKMPRVSHKIIGEYEILVPDHELQILDKMRQFLLVEDEMKNKISSSKALQKSLINQVF